MDFSRTEKSLLKKATMLVQKLHLCFLSILYGPDDMNMGGSPGDITKELVT